MWIGRGKRTVDEEFGGLAGNAVWFWHNDGIAASYDLRPVSSYILADDTRVALHLPFDLGDCEKPDCMRRLAIGLTFGDLDEILLKTLFP